MVLPVGSMSLPVQLLVGLVALIVLVYGAHVIVRRVIGLARHYGIPDVVMAITVLSVGTSLPELVSHLVASHGILRGQLSYEIASATVLGANIGSDVVQQTLVVGIVVLYAVWYTGKPFRFSDKFLRRDYLPMIGTTLMTLVLAWDGILSRFDGLVLFSTFVLYIWYIYAYRGESFADRGRASESPGRDVLTVLVGLVLVVASADVLLRVVESLVHQTGLGGSLIGVMTLGIASALPEMFTALAGLREESAGISLGTLIGSNITNPLMAIGLGSMASTYWVPRPLVLWDLPMETVTAAMLLTYLIFVSDRKLGKWGALYLIALYFAYVTIRFVFFAVD